MSLASLIFALLIEQARPLPYRRLVFAPLARFADTLDGLFNAGERRHGVIAWLLGVGGVTAGGALLFFALAAISPLLGFLFNVLILYLTMGFRQFSHYYTDIQLALRSEDLARARRLLAEWRGESGDALSSSEVARLAIEQALADAHRHVFGVLLCFLLLPGPCGALLYRAAAVFAERWSRPRDDAALASFGSFAARAFAVIDWLPLRATAAAFAVVGNFEDAIYCWRTQADKWPESGIGTVLASGAGALGVRLGMPLAAGGEIAERAELGTGDDADTDYMQGAVGLVWRALVLWLLLLALLGLAGLVGV